MKRWRVLITETIHRIGTDLLEPVADWRLSSAPDDTTLLREVRDIDGLILRARGFVGAEVMDAAPRLRVIGRHGVGVDNVDLDAATARGIWVVNTPEANAEAVAEHVFGVVLAFSKRIVAGDAAVRAGDWAYRNRDHGFEIHGLTLGVVGMGRVGARVAAIGALGFGQRVLYTDAVARPDAEKNLGARRVTLDELLTTSDIVTLHVPSTPDTSGMMNRERFRLVKPGAFFINASRGTVVDEPSLVEALTSGRLAGAALDVFAVEPIPPDSPFLILPNVILSPHKAGQTEESMRRMALVAEDILRVLKGEEPRYPVNRPERLKQVVS
ncbi:hydroxyacid dehydrogenase [Candidatus Poribacteria bacterium]|nr:hydroxyacid dehydrogenase [Candidatus Poribacteria bacterium]